MLNWFNKYAQNEKGSAAVEFGLVLPILLLLFSGFAEYGRAYFQVNAIEKGLRAATLYAARADSPLSATDALIAENILKTGTADGSGAFLVSGWGKPGAGHTITSTDFDVDGTPVPVIHIQVTVPFDPMSPGFATMVGLGGFTISLNHEQPHVGI
ncbi:MAG: pilus assembly protein [Rhodospirillales bacterium]|nr:pilus assembly protein [Rhodospirillales bacterium]